ncbi:MAG: primase C-terminal domain-containing protein [Fusobacteriaceae bacterium]
MKPFDQLKHHPIVEDLVNILSARTQNPDKAFFTMQVCFHLAKLASQMRAMVDAQGLGKLQCNFYGINTAPSGYGKGHSTKIIEEQVTHMFRDTFKNITLPAVAELNLESLANARAHFTKTNPAEELEAVKTEYRKIGKYIDSFDSGTAPALKQFRHGLLMTGIGSINFDCDEFASKLLGNTELLTTYLELYDGTVKAKLTKNTAESVRNEEIEGKTPTNMMLYGTPVALLDGSIIEQTFRAMLETGFGRRCFFGYSLIAPKTKKLTVQERLKMLTDKTSDKRLMTIAIDLEKLANPINHNFTIQVPDPVMEAIIEYQMHCEELMEGMKSNEVIHQAEARGRHFKTIRLAGVFAFLDSSPTLQMQHWEAAVKVAEISAQCFKDLMAQEPAHARLANYLAECKEPATAADLMEALPFFPKSSNQQRDILKLAVAWGHRHNTIIKKYIVDDIEFFQGEALQDTDLNQCMLSHSTDIAEGYIPETKVPFDKMSFITTRPNTHWCNHHFVNGQRRKTHAIKGFNLLVLDIDGTCPLEQAKNVLKDYTYHIYTTKRHRVSEDGKPAADRYRIVIPMSHTLKLTPEEYKIFMDNVLEFLPFETDEQTTQPNRKWLSNPNATTFDNDGKLFDVLPFIPKTKKNEERKQSLESVGSMDKLERYFYSKIEEGNRNNTLFKFGTALIDAGLQYDDLVQRIKAFNKKLPKPIPQEELVSTVLTSVERIFIQKG